MIDYKSDNEKLKFHIWNFQLFEGEKKRMILLFKSDSIASICQCTAKHTVSCFAGPPIANSR